MCALFGWLDCGNKLPHKLLKKFTQELANAAEERGTDASGISYVQNGKIKIYKKAKPAHKVKFIFPEGTNALMGHTRLTTQGNQKYNFNNHPFYGKSDKEFAFAHNGVLYNDDTLRKEKQLPKTRIETDSYVAVQLLERQGKLDFDSLKSMAEDVQGNFTFTILDQYNTLYFVKGSSPMFLIYFEQLGLFAYASTESIMSKAMRKSELNQYKYSRILLYEGDILSIDKKGKTEVSEFETFSYQYSLGYSAGYGCHEELLLEMCTCFGVSEDDIMLLLDFGYTADDIEEMLMDSDLLSDTIADIKEVNEYEELWEYCV
ncbi:MAG: glucosamine 6-phosphate synthetase [Porcipelethomonas sp.]